MNIIKSSLKKGQADKMFAKNVKAKRTMAGFYSASKFYEYLMKHVDDEMFVTYAHYCNMENPDKPQKFTLDWQYFLVYDVFQSTFDEFLSDGSVGGASKQLQATQHQPYHETNAIAAAS